MRYLQHVEKFVDGMKVVEVLKRSEANPEAQPAKNDGTVFFCMHGYGANAYDLAGLSAYLDFPEGTRMIFPNGILGIDMGYGGQQGRAWFNIDWVEIERIRREGGLRDLSKSLPPGMADARDTLIAAMEKLECDPARTIVGGFSQGAMLATEIMLNHSSYLKGLIVFSGTLVNRIGWEQTAANKYGAQSKVLSFIQSHGTHDPVLPVQAAHRLYALLTEHGGEGKLVEFAGQHEIPAQVIDETNNWLREQFR
ncbi:alpha/beta hydrolase [Turneriella parva]|uniref:Phospholipase/Carboxylesterase n=1 Tax=Turneriella parva (strain ATCC BAA-1111 / DSM 21527 / NCTC 11395 / H) TaxID=869212 RepID=I4BAS9_TURPD|nr:phospholipase/carboxylesterase [Turneriella parva]AFM14386.1 phospholipase/Carboxylesterase [Turneriella parva DSM 21527]